VPVPYEELPVELPEDVEFMPTGESPLNYNEGFLHTTCPECGGPATRETDTMDTFVCSSWYQYSYLNPYYREGEPVHADASPWAPEQGEYWLPVDSYTGGAEHAVLHLLYTRFFTKALRDAGLVEFDEPMLQLRNQGIILGEPRAGDCVAVTGHWEEAAFRAEGITAYSFEDPESWPAPVRGDSLICGELWDRDDVTLKVQVAPEGGEPSLVVVHVDEETPLTVEEREGESSVADLLYHLDVEKMSKSKKNVVSPDDLVEGYGADAVRAYLMFGWRWELGGPWDSQGIEGVIRWLHRVWNLVLEEPREQEAADEDAERRLQREMHRAIKAVTEDLENFSFNTVIARLMEYTNALNKEKAALWSTEIWDEGVSTLLLLMAPITPHVTEELWALHEKPYSIHQQAWPTWDEAMLVEESVEIPVQINGKVRARIVIPADADEETIKQLALEEPNVQRYIEGKQIRKIIIPQGKLVSIVVS
jgi:leucyl-tRNA synthetase